MKHPLQAGAVALAAALCVPGAQAQVETVPKTGATTVAATPMQDDGAARGDRRFMEQAAQDGLFEVEISRLAVSRAADPAVKGFAGMLVEHHSAANTELAQLAGARGVTLPTGLPRGLRKQIDKLGKLSGAEFDKAYVSGVGIRAHRKDIQLFEKAGRSAKDAQLKAWIDKTLPTLREHLAQAQKLPQSGKLPARAG